MWIQPVPARKHKNSNSKKTVSLAPAREILAELATQAPPNVYLDKALELLGPEVRLLLRSGWIDEDLVKHFNNQDTDAFRELLMTLRAREESAQRIRVKTAKARKQGTATLKRTLLDASPEPTLPHPPVPLLPGGNGPRQAATPRLSAPKLMLPGPAAGGNHHVTRNRGIRRRPDQGPD